MVVRNRLNQKQSAISKWEWMCTIMRKPLAIGIDDFRRIREEQYYYVDKTLLIKDFLDNKRYVSLITRPRRFGKTLNMTMLREFFDITKDSKDIFHGLHIMETEHAKKINSIPIIYLTFKNCSGNTLSDLKESLALTMWDEYERYAKIFTPTISKEADDYYFFYQTLEMIKKGQITDALLVNSLSNLIKTISVHYNKRPLLFIDEYDHPLIKSHEKGFRGEFSELYGGFLGKALKGNIHLEQALLTGIQRVAKESIFSELNNFLVYTILDELYSPYFGLTESETSQTFAVYNEELSGAVRLYYDGYIIGGLNIYNPWSILCYLERRKLKPYWINTSTNALIKDSIRNADYDFIKAFEKLVMDDEVEVSVNLEASFMELASTKTLWGLLINSGYLTVTKEYTSRINRLKIPNLEVKDEFRGIVASYTRLNNDKLNELFDALMDQNMERFLLTYQDLIYDYVSMYDVKENSYHMLFLGMAISVSGMYHIKSNQEAGDGRPDIVLESLQPNIRPHIIFEFKHGEDVKQLAQKALDQILDKKYYSPLKGNVLCVGIAHSMKKCELIYEELYLG